MYNRIMVPLDGSEMAECVLPHVEVLARACSTAHVTFIRVVEPVYIPASPEHEGSGVFSTLDAQHMRNNVDSENMAVAEEYVTRVAARNRYPGTEVEARVIMGKPAETIAEYAKQNGIDLIVIATHGLSGVSRWVWGSIADRVLRAACVPVLMVRAPGCVSGF
jgi:nucleotide-binding universal stress UspA family protein